MDTYQDSFIYLGGRHGYNVANWLTSQVGQPGVWLILLVTAICFLIYVSARTVIWLRKLFTLSFLKRTKKEETEEDKPAFADQQPKPEFVNPKPHEVEFSMDRTFQQVPASKETKVKEPEVQEPDVREPEFVVPANTEHELPAGEEVTMTFEPTTPDPLPAVDKQADKEPDFEIEVAEDDDENYRGKETEPYNPKLDLENYRFPTIDLMRHYEIMNLPSIWKSKMQTRIRLSIHCVALVLRSARSRQR